MTQVLVLGATGFIGSAVARELTAHGHHVTALSRSVMSDEKLEPLGVEPIRGDLRNHENWCAAVRGCDAIVQAAATFSDDMGDVDAGVLSAIEGVLGDRSERLRMVYTGGCWLYGATGDDIADESSPFNPIPSFAWMVRNARMLLESERFSTAVIHPAMVYDRDGGVFEDYLEAAKTGRPVEIWGTPDTRWPLVHRDDLACAYRLLVETPEAVGHFNASAETGVRTGEIASGIARHFGHECEFEILSVEEVVDKYGDWGEGPTLDQQMSSKRLPGELNWRPKYESYKESDIFQ